MPNSVAPAATAIVSGNPAGVSNPLKGTRLMHLSPAFAGLFPIGSVLTLQQFDDWCEQNGLLIVPQPAAGQAIDLGSDAWLGHIARRNKTKNDLNKALMHDRMRSANATPCRLVTIRAQAGPSLKVIALGDVVAHYDVTASVMKIVKRHHTRIKHAMQASDWNQIPVEERLRLLTTYEYIDDFVDRINGESARLNRRVDSQIALVARVTAAGNQAVAALTAPANNENGESEDDSDLWGVT